MFYICKMLADMIRRSIFIFLFLLMLCTWFARANEHQGVYFNSKEVTLEKRTGIDLTRKGVIPYKNSFSIDFEISFRDFAERYGYILQLKETEGNNQLDLIYNIDGKFPDIFVVLNKRETELQIGLSREQIELVNRWHKFNLTIDAASGEMSLTIDGETVSDQSPFPDHSKLEWVFGVVDRYGFDIDEVPPMSVRNIRFSEQGKTKYFWPLNYSQKRMVKDSVQGKVAEIINPSWVVEQHQKWQLVKTFEFSNFPQIVFNKKTEDFYFVQRDQGLTKYSLNSRRLNFINYNSGNPFYEDAQQAYFDKNEQLRTYSDYKKLSPKFDESKSSWDNKYDTLAYLPKYWHHNSLLDPVDSSFVTIAGYGFFTYFNTIRKFNDDNDNWEEMSMKGDLFEPRYLSSLGRSTSDKNVYYLFGGLGNPTGKQILGKEFYYDLYKIDFEAKYISKVWELNEEQKDSYTPVNSMILNEDKRCFYTLCFSHGNNDTFLQLFKGSIDKPEVKFIGSKIPYSFYDITSFADLYNWKTHNKLVVVTLHQTTNGRFQVNLYSLNYPPTEEPIHIVKEANQGIPSQKYLIGIIIVLVLALLIVLFRRRKTRQYTPDKEESSVPVGAKIPDINQSGGKILTFGGFQVFDKSGKDITYRFSPTLKELFLMILLSTVDGNKGISSKKIQEYLWPDKPLNKAKNNRAVNIKKLRSILQDVGNITISYDGNYWRVTHGDQVFCDIEFIRLHLGRDLDPVNLIDFLQSISVLSRGSFLIHTESEWLDNLKDDISGKIVQRLEEVCSLLDIRKNEKELFEIADVLFTFDPMNETALKNKCSILNHQGKHSLAVEIYNHYIKLYQKLYNEEFSLSFKQLID